MKLKRKEKKKVKEVLAKIKCVKDALEEVYENMAALQNLIDAIECFEERGFKGQDKNKIKELLANEMKDRDRMAKYMNDLREELREFGLPGPGDILQVETFAEWVI